MWNDALPQVLAAPLPENMERELVIVDDCSTDGTSAILDRIAAEHPSIRLYPLNVNEGKGAAVRTAIEYAKGDFCICAGCRSGVRSVRSIHSFCGRCWTGTPTPFLARAIWRANRLRVLPFWHSMMNKGLTLLSNMFCNLNLTDMETCYKVFRTDLLKSIPIRSDRFGFEPEITMKCAKRKLRIYEVPDQLSRPHLRGRQEDRLEGRREGAGRDPAFLADRRSVRRAVRPRRSSTT